MDTKLFERGNFGICLTKAGTILYDYVSTANDNISSSINIYTGVK